MSWFRREKETEVVVSPEGLANLVRDLHFFEPGLLTALNPIGVKVFAQSSGNFRVYLDSHQRAVLLSRLPLASLETEYGVST